MKQLSILSASLLAISLTACGGGGSSNPPRNFYTDCK